MSGLFSDPAPVQAAAKPTTVPAAPNRSASEVEALAERQRKKFSSAGSFTKNYFTGGDTGEVSTTTRVLGGGGI
jgi:hypothetical protein